MKKNILFLAFVLASVVSFAQFSNYTNINGRYKWIAGKFDSTFTIPTGSTPSLRTGGANAPGAMFYRTTDSTIYQYTGTQWIKLRGGISPTDTAGLWITNLYRRNGTDSVFYVKGGSHTFAFRDSVGNAGGGGGGGKIYYFNGGVSMGTIGGLTMYELGDTANTGAAANFTRATTGNLANFITDPGKPGLLQIPAGVWTVDAYLSETGGGANHAQIWIEVEKWDGSTITTIATSPIEEITNGSVIDLYTWSVSIPTTSLAITDRIVIQFYISNTNGKTVTLYTQNGYVGEVQTTFTTGIGSLNGLTAPSQFFATGTSGTDFNISSSTATHTFNLPTASATNRGALSTTDWSTFNNKIGGSGTTNYVSKFTASGTIGNSQIFDNGSFVGIGGISSPLGNRFEVIETVNPATVGIRGGGGNNGLNFVDFTTFTGIGTKDIKPLYFYNGDTVRLAISSSGNVGIGENLTADSALMVDKGTHLKRGVRMSGLPTGVGTKALRINANGQLSIADTLANGISGSGTTNYVAKFTGTNAVGNSQIFDNGTNVGVGTSSPQSQLDVAGNSSELVRISSTATNGSYLGFRNSGTLNGAVGTGSNIISGLTNSDLGLWTTGVMVFQTNGSERMRLDASGNLGLGTSSPQSKFHLYSAVGTATELIRMQSDWNNPSGNKSITWADATNVLGRISVSYSAPAAKMTFGSLYNSGYQSSDLMTLDASGNLGLGVTPIAWGASYKAIQISSYASITQGGNDTYIGNNWYNDGTNKYLQTNAASLYGQSTGRHIWYNAPSGTAGNAISFTQAMTLDASGRLGIGVTSPATRLEVQNGTAGADIRVSNTGGGYAQLAISSNATSVAELSFTNSLSLTGGSVGIGTSSPSNILQITAAAGSSHARWTESATTIGFVGGANGIISGLNGSFAVRGESGLVLSGAGNAANVYINSSGNVGIGVTPSAWTVFNPILQIKTGSLAGSGTANFRMFANTYYDGSYKYIGTGTATQYEQDGYHAWYTAPSGTAGNAISFSERMRISGDGEVLIGTTTDAGLFKLQVDGNIYGSGLIQILGSIETGNPNGGTSKRWKLGSKVAASVSFDANNYIEVDLNGTLYKLALAQ